MNSFPKRKTLLAGALAFIFAALQLPALAAHHEEQKSDSSPGSTEQPMEHQGHKGGTMMDGQKRGSEMDHESHEGMEDMDEDHMNHDDSGDISPDRDTDMEQGEDETEE